MSETTPQAASSPTATMLLAGIRRLGSSVLPFVTRMCGLIYLGSALTLGAVFLWYALTIYWRYTDAVARAAFRYSIIYLSVLFAALMVDHYWRVLSF